MGWKTSQFIEHLVKNYYDDSSKGYFIEADVQYPKNFPNLHNDLPSLPEKKEKLKTLKNLYATCMIKKNMLLA